MNFKPLEVTQFDLPPALRRRPQCLCRCCHSPCPSPARSSASSAPSESSGQRPSAVPLRRWASCLLSGRACYPSDILLQKALPISGSAYRGAQARLHSGETDTSRTVAVAPWIILHRATAMAGDGAERDRRPQLSIPDSDGGVCWLVIDDPLATAWHRRVHTSQVFLSLWRRGRGGHACRFWGTMRGHIRVRARAVLEYIPALKAWHVDGQALWKDTGGEKDHHGPDQVHRARHERLHPHVRRRMRL